MSVRVSNDFGAAENNKAIEVLRFKSLGPVQIVLNNQSATGTCVMSVEKLSDGSAVATDKDTDVTAEGPPYTGNASTLVFTGQVLNNLPIVPGSVDVTPTAGGNTVDCTDVNKDGILYSTDVDLDVCGTINYFTGALELSYPLGKDPNTGAITADYSYQDILRAKGHKNYTISNLVADETLICKVATDIAGGALIKAHGVSTWS